MIAEAGELTRLIGGALLVLFVPGLAWSYVLARREADVSIAERLALAVALSVTGSVLGMFALHTVLEVPISAASVVVLLLTLTAIGVAVAAWRHGFSAPR